MIASVSGVVLNRQPDALVIGLGGLGVRVFVPADVARSARPGDELALFTHLHVREQELTLYGFASEQDLALFLLLLGVSGIGPKLALGVLSGMPVDALRLAIGQEQPGVLARIPGIGKKTAERMLVELRDRAADLGGGPAIAGLPGDALSEAITALQALGYKPGDAEKMAKKVAADGDDAPIIIRKALQSALR